MNLCDLFYMRRGGEEYHKPGDVRISIIQELMRPAEQVDCMMLSSNNDIKKVENLYRVGPCFLHGPIWML